MKRFLLVIGAVAGVLFGASGALRADDAKANEVYGEGMALYDAGDFYNAAEKFKEAEFEAESGELKANAVRRRIGCFQMCELPFREFESIEHLLSEYPQFAGDDYSRFVSREFELGNQFYQGKREPEFYALRAIPWLHGKDKSVEIYTKALERAPFSKQSAEARLRLAYIYDEEGKLKESAEELRTVIKDFPNSSEARWAYLALGNALYMLSKRGDGDARYSEECYDIFMEFKKRYPDAPEAAFVDTCMARVRDVQAERMLAIGKFYEKRSQPFTAKRYYADILREFPESSAAVTAERGLAKLDRTFVPDDFSAPPGARFERYKTFDLPNESGKLLIVPTRDQRTYLLPVYDLGINPDTVQAAGTAVKEDLK